MSFKVSAICLKFSLAAVFLLFLQPGYTQQNFAELDKAAEAQKKIMGNDFTVAVIGPDSLFWQKEYGGFNTKTQIAAGAASQWFTTALLMQLADEGKLSLDDKISKYLPVFESYGKAYITIRHCLTHQTGIQAEGNKILKIFERKKFNTLDEAMTDIAKKEIQNNPGIDFRYNGMGFEIAGKIAEVVTKKKFDALIKQRLFTPLGMRNTTFSTPDASAPNPATGARTTPADYSRFLQMLLANGKFGDKQILSTSAIAEMRKIQINKPQIKYAPKAADNFTYAFGTWVSDGGTTLGSQAAVLVCPSFTGIWPTADFSRGYGLLIFDKNELDEPKADAYLELKRIVDKQFK